jgi:hypothetical protein
MEITKGTELVLNQDIKREPFNAYRDVTMEKGTVVRVTQGPFRDGGFRFRGYGEDRYGYVAEYTLNATAADLEDNGIFVLDPNAPKPRKLGEAPEAAISPDDPRIAWLWEDAAKLANRMGHCSTYDSMCDKLGIPGRERDFTVSHEVNGITGTFKVKARSQKLAEAQVAEALA